MRLPLLLRACWLVPILFAWIGMPMAAAAQSSPSTAPVQDVEEDGVSEVLITEDVASDPPSAFDAESIAESGDPASSLSSFRPVETAPIITAIEVRSDTPIGQPADLADLVTVPIGEPLDLALLRRSLRNIQATGLAYEVDALLRQDPEATQEDESDPQTEARPRAVLVFVIWAAVQLESVEIEAEEEGSLGLNLSTLRSRLEARAGEPLFEDRLVRGVYNLKNLYVDRGFFEASVRLEVEVDGARQQAAIVYRVDAGPRAKIAEVRFDGDLGPFDRSALIETLKGTPGSEYRSRISNEDTDRLRKWLIERGHRAAVVSMPTVDYRRDSDSVEVTFEVEVGPKIEVQIIGATRKELQKRELLPFLGDDGYDEALVLQAVGKIERDFQERGYYEVTVDWREERPADDRLNLFLTIEQGPVFTLEALEFEGNEAFSDERLEELFQTAPKRLLSLGSGRLVESVLDEDLSNLRSFYALEGFVGTEVSQPKIETIGPQGQELRLVVPIKEGTRRRLVDLNLDGVTSLDVDELRGDLALVPGGPFHPLLLEETLDQIVGRYMAAGYEAVQASAREDWDAERRLVDVTIEVFEGPLTVVGRVIVRGNLRTQTSVIENALDITSGAPISRALLLEVERRLYRLGIFSRVDVDLVPAPIGSTTRDVLVKVAEGRTRRLTYGVGYDYDGQSLDGDPHGVGGLLGFSQTNLLGRAYTLQFDLRARTNDQLARIVLDQPTVGGRPVSVIYSLSHQREDRETYEVERSVARIEGYRLFDERRFGLGLDYRQVASTIAPLAVTAGDEVFVERSDQDVEIFSIVPSVGFDYRDDPIDPVRGWSAQFRGQYAVPILDTNADFFKLFSQISGYLSFERYGGFAAGLRVGAIEPFGDATENSAMLPEGELEPENLMVPIDERFFAGGNYSHRAFDQDELGIQGSTLIGARPRGGNGVVLINLDYRFPLVSALDGVVFFDAGNVWESWRDIDLGALRPGAGFGVRYRSPIGPIRAGVAWNLDRDEGESELRFVVALGNPF